MLNPKRRETIRVETNQMQDFYENTADLDLLVNDIENVRQQVEQGVDQGQAVESLFISASDLQDRGDINGGAAAFARYFDVKTAMDEGALNFRTELVVDRPRQARRIAAAGLIGALVWGGVTKGPEVVSDFIENDNEVFRQRHQIIETGIDVIRDGKTSIPTPSTLYVDTIEK